MRRFNRKAVLAAACLGLVGPSVFAVDFPETEPNNSKATPNVRTLAPGDTISGTTTGTFTIAAGLTTSDNFDVTTTAAPSAGIWRYRLALTSTIVGHTGTIRGLTQSLSVINTTSDGLAQTSSTSTLSTPPRMNQWYANETPSRIIYRVTGAPATTAAYAATLTRDPVVPVIIPGTVSAGPVVISTIGSSVSNTEFWLYDANFNPIADAGNDDESIAGGGTGLTSQSRLPRTLAAGTYILAISLSNIANNLPAPTDDDVRSGTVMDFSNALVSSAVSVTPAALDFSIVHGTGTIPVAANRTEFFSVLFYQFTVAVTPNPVLTACVAAPSATVPQGASVTLSTNVAWTNAPGTVTADLSAFGGSSTEALADNGGGNFSVLLTVPGAQALGAYNVAITATDATALVGSCSIPLTVIVPPPANDTCAGALVALIGTTTGNNSTATSAGDPVPTCQTTSGRGVFYTFTAGGAGSYTMNTEGSVQPDTVLNVYDACGGLQLACDDDSGISPSLSSSLTVALTAAQTVIIQVKSFGAAPVGGGFNLNIIAPPCVLFLTQPAAIISCAGQATSFTTTVSTTGTPAFLWQTAPIAAGPYTDLVDGVAAGLGTVSGATTASVTISNLDIAATTTRFRVVVTGDCGSGTSNNVGLTVLDCPPNDSCANATVATLGTQTGTNVNATSTGDQAASCQTLSGKGVFFSFTAGATAGTYLIDTEGSAQLDTVLTVYDACGGTQLACDDDGGTSPANSSRLTVALAANQTVIIQVKSFGSAPVGGGYTLNIATCTVISAQPADTTVAPAATAGFSVTAAGPGTLTYVWQRQLLGVGAFTAVTNGVVAGLGTVSGATTANLSIANADIAASTDKFRAVVTSACNSATSNVATLTVANPFPARCNGADIAYDDGQFLPRAAIIDGTNGTPEIVGPFTGTNNGVTEADYNVFFANFFDANSVADIANDDGSSRFPTPAPGTVTNNGVTEGDYNYFFGVFFDGCSL